MKILLTLNSPPEGMNASQLFDSKKHLDDWMIENMGKLKKISINSTTLTCDKGLIETKDDNFKNYTE